MSASEHCVCVVVREGFYGYVQVSEHCFGLLSYKDADDVAVYAAKEYCHSPNCAEQASRHFLGAEANSTS